jgi:hypothetical protein
MTCFVGLDVSMEETAYCARNAEGRVLGEGKTVTDPDAIAAALARFGRPTRVVLETGRMANSLHRQLIARDPGLASERQAGAAPLAAMTVAPVSAPSSSRTQRIRRCVERG